MSDIDFAEVDPVIEFVREVVFMMGVELQSFCPQASVPIIVFCLLFVKREMPVKPAMHKAPFMLINMV